MEHNFENSIVYPLTDFNYSIQNHASVLVDGTCQIPDPVYKFVGSIVCFYIPLLVMLLTYALTVRLLARQQQSLGGGKATSGGGWSSGWLGTLTPVPPLGKITFRYIFFFNSIFLSVTSNEFPIYLSPREERKTTWRRFMKTSMPSTPNRAHSAESTDTELSALDINTHELWLPESRWMSWHVRDGEKIE